MENINIYEILLGLGSTTAAGVKSKCDDVWKP